MDKKYLLASFLAGITDMRAYIRINYNTSTYQIVFYFSKPDIKIAKATQNILKEEFKIPSRLRITRKDELYLAITDLRNIESFAHQIMPYTLKEKNKAKIEDLGLKIANKKPDTIYYLTAIVDLMAFVRWDTKQGVYAVRINFTEKEDDLFEQIRDMFEELGFETKIYTARKGKGNFDEKQIYIGRKAQVEHFLSIFQPFVIRKERLVKE